MFEWSQLGAALALMCVVEGLLPFVRPSATRRLFGRLLELSDSQLRIGGLCTMATGLVLLFLVRS